MKPKQFQFASPIQFKLNLSIGREKRVLMLLMLLAILSLADLYQTWLHSQTIGMVEMNPVGAYILNSGSLLSLTLFKCGSVGIALLILFKLRDNMTGEMACWVATLIMTCLTIHWYRYNIIISNELANMSYSDISRIMHMAESSPPKQIPG